MSRRVLITGGTGSVGIALISAFVDVGYDVTFQYATRASVARELMSKYRVNGIEAAFSTPVSKELCALEVDVLVNNAAVNLTSASVVDTTDDEWLATMTVNLFTPFALSRCYLPMMMREQWGRIVNVSSIYGLRGCDHNASYVTSKHGLVGLTRTLAKEYAEHGITANAICPGAIDSALMTVIAKRETDGAPAHIAQYLDEVRLGIPAHRMALPEEIANLAVFLASDQAAHITGTAIPLDGGSIA